MPTSSRRVRPRTSGSGGEDTRTALSKAVLAGRWARIPHVLPALDFRVSEILPPEYDRTVALRQRKLPRDNKLASILDGLMARCEIQTMRRFANGVRGFLEADGGHDRHTKTLCLEFFHTYDDICVDRLIAAAVGEWGVEDLEVVVRRSSDDDQTPPYSLPHDCLNLRSRLRSLTLGKYCTVPPLHEYGALTKLVLRDMPASTPVDVYERVFKDCTGLQVFHLMSCCCAHHTLVVDAPSSQIRELVLEECSFFVIELRNLPTLVRLACCLTDTSKILFGSVPCLMDTNLSFSVEHDLLVSSRLEDKFDSFCTSPTMTNLVVRFTELRRYIAPYRSKRKLPDLKRLLVSDLPSNWDILWPSGLLMAAPSLEVLHIHVTHSEEEPDYLCRKVYLLDSRNNLRCHHHLKELVIIGFTQRHIWFLKYVVSMSTSLQSIVLLKDGHVQYNGLWAWQMVGKQTCPWSHDEEMAVKGIIKDFGLRPLVELTLG